MFSLNKHKNKLIGINFILVLFLTILSASIFSTPFSADDAVGSRKVGTLSTSCFHRPPYGLTWISGSKTAGTIYGSYGEKGVPNATNYPGSRWRSVSWTDTNGDLWLFGGFGHAGSGVTGYLNDLWRFNIPSKEWTWISGNNTTGKKSVFGTKGVSNITNYPGARFESVSWTDTNESLWLFGGYGPDELGGTEYLNDLWRFNITSKEWTWISGNKTGNENGVYGTKKDPDMANYPGGRSLSVSWTDTDGNLWLFGGGGYGESGGYGFLNDLWRFNITSNEWTWMSGAKTTGNYGIYGTMGEPNVANYPGTRGGSVSWTDMNGSLWLFGGLGWAESDTGRLNDLWRFNISSNEWAWMLGNKTTTGNYGVYGTKGVPDVANYPGGRLGSVSWTDTDGNLWLFGGTGRGESVTGRLNDLWKFTITSKEWVWMSGSKTIEEYGVYGTKGVRSRSNYPGAREFCVSWTDTDGNLWLFGGIGFAESTYGYMNDLWRFESVEKWYPWYDDDDDDQGEDEDEDNGIIIIIIIMIFGFGSVSGIAATSLYYKQHRKKILYNKPHRKKKAKSILKGKFQEYNKKFHSTPSSKEILRESTNKTLLSQIFDTKKSKKINAILDDILDNIDLTVVSDEFLRKLDLLNVDDEEKREFLKEMLHFSPKERNEILDKILKRLNS